MMQVEPEPDVRAKARRRRREQAGRETLLIPNNIFPIPIERAGSLTVAIPFSQRVPTRPAINGLDELGLLV